MAERNPALLRSRHAIVGGPAAERDDQYANECFFTVCNYEQVLRDILAIERVNWDLIILDEGQRIKNWESKTSRVIKSLRSRFALVLSGTPLENRLDELYSIVQFVDDRRLGPGFRFFNKHRVVDEKRQSARLQEPRRAARECSGRSCFAARATASSWNCRRARTEIVRIPPSDEQKEMHDGHMQIVAAITSKKFITEMDLLRLQKELLMCRMSADSTFLVDKHLPGYSTKLDHLEICSSNCSRKRDEGRCCSPNGPPCST